MIKKILVVFILLLTFNVYAEHAENNIDANNLNITRFEIIGYNIDFNINKYEYTINIPNIINKLSIIVEGENIEVLGDGLVNIRGLDQIIVTVKNTDIEKQYTINLVRQEYGQVIKNNNIEKGFNLVEFILLIVSIVLLIVTIVLVILLKIKRKKELEII